MRIHQLVKCAQFLGFSALCLLVLALIFPLASSHGVDLTSSIRNIRRHQQWMSTELRHPMTGMFLVARASTEDRNKDATLNVTLIPDGSQCSETIEVLFKLESPAQEDVHREGLVEFVLDNQEPQIYHSQPEDRPSSNRQRSRKRWGPYESPFARTKLAVKARDLGY